MSTVGVLRGRFPRAYGRTAEYAAYPGRALNTIGQLAWFAATAIGATGHALRHYRKETLRLVA